MTWLSASSASSPTARPEPDRLWVSADDGDGGVGHRPNPPRRHGHQRRPDGHPVGRQHHTWPLESATSPSGRSTTPPRRARPGRPTRLTMTIPVRKGPAKGPRHSAVAPRAPTWARELQVHLHRRPGQARPGRVGDPGRRRRGRHSTPTASQTVTNVAPTVNPVPTNSGPIDEGSTSTLQLHRPVRRVRAPTPFALVTSTYELRTSPTTARSRSATRSSGERLDLGQPARRRPGERSTVPRSRIADRNGGFDTTTPRRSASTTSPRRSP